VTAVAQLSDDNVIALPPIHQRTTEHAIDRILELARAQLEMEVSFVAEFDESAEKLRAIAGDADSFGLADGLSLPLDGSYCARVVDGRISGIVRDAARNPTVKDLPGTAQARIGSYAGVPIELWNGRVYGTLCCLSHAPNPTLDERDLRFLRVLAQLIADEIDSEELSAEKRRVEAERVQGVLDRGDLDMVFQPMFDISNDASAPIALEALARFWDEPRRSPAEWFSEAAEAGLGLELELAALEVALRYLDELPNNLRLALNVSPSTALSPRFEEILRDVADRIVIELTEHAEVVSYEALAAALAPLRARGARLAIDDVGAGFASLRHILRLEPDIVKLDLSLTHGIADDPARAALASSLVDFARDINATIAAEGIESFDDLALLRELGVTYGQGYYLGRPSALLH
jgi:EAL domain-containing protein (putative c-di-GMP-specific phosphodiesterase class I)